LFGLHNNAEITTNQNHTLDFCHTLNSIQSTTGGADGRKEEEVLEEMAISIKNKMPKAWDLDMVTNRYPTK